MRLLALVALVGLGAYLLNRSRRRLHPDERIRREVRALLPEPDDVQVRVDGGAVYLRGSVSREARDDLLAAVLAIPGVTEISNLLEIEESYSPAAG